MSSDRRTRPPERHAEPIAEFYVDDPGASARRTSGWLVTAGVLLVGVGGIMLVMARVTWSGYVGQAIITCLVGGCLIAGGSGLHRHAAPARLVRVPTGWARPAPTATPTRQRPVVPTAPRRVHAWVEPPRALPRASD